MEGLAHCQSALAIARQEASYPRPPEIRMRLRTSQLGKQDNCQVAVSLSLANRHASLPVAWRLYLPQEWAADPARRRKARVPADITFKTKAEIALDQLR
jgi:SRSO17 transposase